MKKKDLEALFEKQPHVIRYADSDVLHKKPVKVGAVMVGIRYASAEYVNKFGLRNTGRRWNKTPQLKPIDFKQAIQWFTIDRTQLKLVKGMIFEKFTAAGWPVLQTKAYVKEHK